VIATTTTNSNARVFLTKYSHLKTFTKPFGTGPRFAAFLAGTLRSLFVASEDVAGELTRGYEFFLFLFGGSLGGALERYFELGGEAG
jgi:hypothetical protein